MIPRRMQRIVTDDPALAVLWDRTRPLRELQKLYTTLVPPYLNSASRIGFLNGHELKLYADSGAVATRLRLHVPDLLADFRAKGWEFSAIRIAVQVRTGPEPPRKSRRDPPGEQGQRSLARLAEELPESPLRDAVKRLARTRR